MNTWLLDNVRVLEPGRGVVGTSMLIEASRIATIDPASLADDIDRTDGGGRFVTPGLIDMHCHGMGLHLFEQDVESMHTALNELGRFGVTCVAPTLYTIMQRQTLAQLEQLANALAQKAYPHVPGFHLEGPFLALSGAGSCTMPGDVALLKEILAACHGRVAAMSVSPDTVNILPVIEHLIANDIRVFLTHTQATVEQTQQAIDAGACHATHFYDVFPIPAETDPGVRPVGAVETILADQRVSVDFIADGVHVHPMAIRAAIAAKGIDRVCVISDAYLGAGLDPGVYDTGWGYPVKVTRDGAARIDDPGHPNHGHLSGSCLTMDRGINNLMHWLDLPHEQVWQMATSNPARVLGLSHKGSLMPGCDADLVLWDQQDDQLRVCATWCGGEMVYHVNQEVSEASR